MRNADLGIVVFAFAATTAGKTRSRYVGATRSAPSSTRRSSTRWRGPPLIYLC